MIQDIERTTCILTSRNNLQRTLKWRSLSDNFSSVKRCCPGKIFSVYSRCCLSHLSFTDDKYLNITISHKDWKAKHSYHLPKIYTSLSHMTAFKNKTLYHTGLSGSIHKWDSPSGPSVQAAAAHLGEVPSFFFFFFCSIAWALKCKLVYLPHRSSCSVNVGSFYGSGQKPGFK